MARVFPWGRREREILTLRRRYGVDREAFNRPGYVGSEREREKGDREVRAYLFGATTGYPRTYDPHA